jgi:DnaJ-class molecular chaperone
MKTFENENYYRILQIPFNAGEDEIRQAYRDALAIYEEDSIATYSLFSEEQRKNLLQAIEKAFTTLIGEEKRAAYNQSLIDSGQVAADVFSGKVQRRLAAHADTHGTSREESLRQWVLKKAGEPQIKQLIEGLMSRELISGADLKRLREAYGIELPEIYAVTKISGRVLNMIEADQFDGLPAKVYLRQFLRTYAELLYLDPRHVVEGYSKFMAGGKPGC